MSDVDAMRCMASEHDLEFVDLDTYGVDPAAAEILPSELARRHQMVAIKRKFGTPVIATSDPDDLYAQDSVRASIGRDFISVVASSDQISEYLDRLFGSGVDELAPREGRDEPHSVRASPRVNGSTGDVGAEFSSDPIDETVPDGHQAVGPLPSPSGNGSARKGKKSERKERANPAQSETNEPLDGRDWQEFAVDPGLVDAADAGVAGVAGGDEGPGSDTGDAAGRHDHPLEPGEAVGDQPSGGSVDVAEPGATLGALGEEVASLEPATSLLPGFGSDTADDHHGVSGDELASAADELADLARSVEEDDPPPSADSTTLAADLVAEAVVTYQVQHGDGQAHQAEDHEGPAATALFPPLAKALVDGGRVSLEDMETVLEEHENTGQSVAHILTARKLVSEADLMWGMAEEMGLEFVDLDTYSIDFAEAGTIPEATARYHNVMVIGNRDGTPVVAASNPTDVFAMDDLRTIMGRNFIVVVATRTQISACIARAFNSGVDAADMAMEASLGFDGSTQAPGVDDIQAVTEEAPIVRYVNLLILQALNERASDIHVEPTATDLRIRYRIDGVLHDMSTAPRAISAAVTTRLKVMADMNVAEHRIPQDGRISLNVGSKGIDLRMATLPTIHGEKVVMRVLDKSSVVLGFADLGFDEDLLKTYESIYTKPYGTILVTGPTGSGKSTTLYTTLTALNSPEKNIITVEDPVELQLKGVNQVQLNVKAGLTFASALRAILRSDPDIVLVGEIRDKETTVIAIEAALTGHMVLATLHTNSAASTPMRLIEMGVEPFLVTSAISGVLAQRLARRLCMHCKDAYEPTEADIVAAGWTLEEVEALGGMSKVYRAVGCSACANTGYRGRKALAELMPMTEEIDRMIIEGGSVDDIHKLALTQGMQTLRQSGLRKAIEGETTLEEVLRVVT